MNSLRCEDIQRNFSIVYSLIDLESSMGRPCGTICVFRRHVIKVDIFLQLQADHFQAAFKANAWRDGFVFSLNIHNGHPINKCLVLIDWKSLIDRQAHMILSHLWGKLIDKISLITIKPVEMAVWEHQIFKFSVRL